VGRGTTPEIFAQFAGMYTETMTRNQAQPYYFFSPGFFQCVCDELAEHASVFYAVCGNRIIAMELVLFCNGRMHSHLQASLRDCQHLSPVPLLIYSESLWGMGNGIQLFHLGGGLGSAEDNIYQFKSNFNRKSDSRFYTGQRIFDREKYDALLRLRLEAAADVPRENFFPEYRA
jgi:predicted N-acyltransferase